ncbi:MAG: hypothetical protein QG640_329 [Patescibacteria group bacterium]|nr:hypothetical protein [Patescibacteria group bacterium]
MKKIIILVLILAVIGAVAWKFTSSNKGVTDNDKEDAAQDELKVPTSQTVKVSDKLSEYKNDELGFSVKYPTTWERGEAANNVTFSVITDSTKEKNTIGNLQAKIDILSSKCAFPPVTTVKERDVLKVGDLSFNMISIANTVQGRNYFSRMYSLQKDSICYFFTFTSVVLSPTSKGFVGADAQAVGARNTMLVDTTDAQFKDMIKSFKFVVGPAGQDETKVSPKK